MVPRNNLITSLLNTPTYLFVYVGVSLLLFDLGLLILWFLPGTRDAMCMERAYFTPFYLGYVGLLSLVIGVLVLLILYGVRQHYRSGFGAFTGVAGSVLGFLALFCGACSLPLLITFLGAVGLGSMGTILYHPLTMEIFHGLTMLRPFIMVLALGLLLAGVIMLERHLSGEAQCRLPTSGE